MKVTTVYEVKNSKGEIGRYTKIKDAAKDRYYPDIGTDMLIAYKCTGEVTLIDKNGDTIYEELPTEVNQVLRVGNFEIWIDSGKKNRSEYLMEDNIIGIRNKNGEDIFKTDLSVCRKNDISLFCKDTVDNTKRIMEEGVLYGKRNILFFLTREGDWCTGIDTFIKLHIFGINGEKIEPIMEEKNLRFEIYRCWRDYNASKEKRYVEFQECEHGVININCYTEDGTSEYYFSIENGQRLQKKIVYEPI